MNVIIIIVLYLIIVNLLGFILMWSDKNRARKRSYRIPEANLFLVALIGGSLGSIIGMYVFHHKTRKRVFAYGMPFILFLQIAFVVALILSPIAIAFL